MKNVIIKAITSALLFILIVILINNAVNRLLLKKTLEIEVVAPHQNDCWQVFYDLGRGYRGIDSSHAQVTEDKGVEKITFDLYHLRIKNLRIDPGTQAGDIFIKSITFRVGNSSYIWSAKQISDYFRPLHQINGLNENKGILLINSVGGNPYFQYAGDFGKIDESLSEKYEWIRSILYILGLFIVARIFLFFKKFEGFAKAVIRFISGTKNFHCLSELRKRLDCLGSKISEEQLLIFDYKVLLLLFLILFIFTLSISFKLNGSSSLIWEKYIAPLNSQGILSGAFLGQPKGTRSDEWGLETPKILSQVAHGFKVSDNNIGYGKATLIANLPVKHYTTIFRPQFYGFFIFRNVDTAFSFYWNYKVFGLFLSTFFFLMLLTENSFWLSIFGAIWLYFSSFVQWWFSTPSALPEMITAFCIIFIAVTYLMFSRKRINIILSAFILFAYLVNFALTFYPPHQLPLIYLVFFLIVGYGWRKHQKEGIFASGHIGLKSTIAAAILLVLIVFAWSFFSELKDTILHMLNTIYPGKRRVFGGGFPIRLIFSGYYDSMFKESVFPHIYPNICEASNFILFFPFVIFYYLKENFLKKCEPLMISLMLYLLFMFFWVSFGLPPFLASKVLLTLVTYRRALIGIGIASILLTIIFLRSSKEKTWSGSPWKYALFLLLFLIMLWHGNFLSKMDPVFTIGRILFVSIWFAATLLFLYYRKKVFFALFVIILLIPNVLINPVVSGLRVFRNEPIIRFVKIIDGNKQNKWLVYGNPVMLPEFFKAAGLNVINGEHYIPDLGEMKVLDNQGKNKHIYNCTGWMTAHPCDGDLITFNIIHNNVFDVSINPLSPELKTLGVKYFIFPADTKYFKRYHFDIENAKRRGLLVINKEPINGFWVCTIKSGDNHFKNK